MAKTPFNDIKSEDILSAHISGIQHAVNKVENVLNMTTATKTAHVMTAVKDQTDATLHYFIYEGTTRNWLTSPAPVIKRNGVVVTADEYTLQAAYGAIVFNAQQASTAVITADFTHIDQTSGTIATIESRISDLETATTGISENSGTFNIGEEVYNNILPQIGSGISLRNATNVTVAGNRIDALPIIISQTVKISKMRISFSAGSTGANNLMGIYDNKNVIEPGKLLATTAVFRHESATGAEILEVPLLTPATLEPGIYWLARWANDGVKIEGQMFNPSVHIAINAPATQQGIIASQTALLAMGVRTGSTSTGAITTLPATFQSVGTSDTANTKYLVRDSIATIDALV